MDWIVAIVLGGLAIELALFCVWASLRAPSIRAAAPDPDAKPVLYGAQRSSKWPRVRDEHLAKEPRCAACGGAEQLQVHHLLPFATHPAYELDPDNLITLCEKPSRNCHFRIGHSFNWRSYNPHCLQDAALSMRRIAQRVNA